MIKVYQCGQLKQAVEVSVISLLALCYVRFNSFIIIIVITILNIICDYYNITICSGNAYEIKSHSNYYPDVLVTMNMHKTMSLDDHILRTYVI